ncbi:MAG: SRPBCC family protein [Deltaproteobacteria bacterium]|nr:SRPBCC family protein [Deltaproteobacteria bacterium]
MPRAERSIEFNASPQDCYAIIKDVAKYPEFVGDLKAVRVLDQKGERLKAEFTVTIVKEVKYTLELWGTPGKSFEWTLVEGFMKKNNGLWTLVDLGDGRTRATYAVELELPMLVPKTVVKVLLEQSFPKMLQQFKERIEASVT